MEQRNTRPVLDDSIEQLANLQRLGQALYEREAGRLARKHGLADPRVQRMVRTASGARQTLDALETTHDAVPRAQAATKEQIVVYGRVASDDLKGASRLEVVLEDANGRVMRMAGSATTDVRGRYTLAIPTGVAEKLAGHEYTLSVRDARGNSIGRTQNTLKLALGQATEIDLTVEKRTPVRRQAANVSRRRSAQPAREPEAGPTTDAASEGSGYTSQPNTLVAYRLDGEVRGVEGQPISNSLVRVFDQHGEPGTLLGAALTNREGAFSVEYRSPERDTGEASTQLAFTIHNAEGDELLATTEQVVFDAKRTARATLTIPHIDAPT